MKKSLRFASAALAVALAASCAAPAFAAGGSSFTKSETVYAVMNADGSIQSTTVSEHVYSASGLSKVTDQSTLTNIQNTESSAEFTQDGEKLVWNTDDTDVYYKGDTDRALPIQATVTYALDGQEAALEDLIGKSGHLTMTIALKNNETGTVNVNGTDRTIVTPLVTAVGVIFGQDATNVVAAHGLVESAAKSNVAAFVTLPGVKDSLSGLLPDELDTIEDYLQDTITVEADVTELTCPQVMMACATSAAALGTDNVFDLSSLNDLTDGINQLNDAMSQLLDGASQLEDGTSQLSSGVLALLVCILVPHIWISALVLAGWLGISAIFVWKIYRRHQEEQERQERIQKRMQERMKKEIQAERERSAKREKLLEEKYHEEDELAQREKELNLEFEKQMWNQERISAESKEKQVILNNLEESLQELQEENEQSGSIQEELDAVRLAIMTMNQISEDIYKESAAHLNQKISDILSQITEGRYTSVFLDANMEVRINTPKKLLSLEQVSRGTMEQIYFALRMAVGEMFCQDETMPIILDDAFVMYDDKRLKQTLKWLYHSKRQVILFTCHGREQRILDEIKQEN